MTNLERVRKEGIFDKSFHYDLNTKSIYEGCQVPPVVDNSKDDALFNRLTAGLPSRLRGGKLVAVHSYPP